MPRKWVLSRLIYEHWGMVDRGVVVEVCPDHYHGNFRVICRRYKPIKDELWTDGGHFDTSAEAKAAAELVLDARIKRDQRWLNRLAIKARKKMGRRRRMRRRLT